MRYNPNNYYREVSKEAIDDAINSGVVRSGNTKRYIGPFFGKGYTPWQREKYIIEGYPENNDWIYANPYENAVYVMQDEPELGKALMQDAFKKIPKNSNVGAEAFPYRNGSINSTPTTNFDYWKKYPLLGWRKNNFKQGGKMNILEFLKNGSGIHIKEKNKGSFTRWCGGNVTEECIRRGKNSPNPKIRKKATFADNARHFKHRSGGKIDFYNLGGWFKNTFNNVSSFLGSDTGKSVLSIGSGLLGLGKGISNSGKIADTANEAEEAINA
jgi:hypothetical protein